jgi:uncharacterized protein involved in response to NO
MSRFWSRSALSSEREIIAGNKTRNLKVLAVVTLLFIGKALFHLEAIAGSGNGHGTRIGIAAIERSTPDNRPVTSSRL